MVLSTSFRVLAFPLTLGAAVALTSCGPSPSETPEKETVGAEQVPPPAPAAVEAETIPVNLRGNWGMNAADCEGGASAKGLLEIDGTTLTFYESVGTLENVDNASPGSIQAEFAFEGEGMEWTREMRLETHDGGQVLVRQELGDEAMPDAIEYRKCT